MNERTLIHCRECGLDTVWLDVGLRDATKGGFIDAAALDLAIGKAIAWSQCQTSGAEVRFMWKAMGLRHKDLAALLDVSEHRANYWGRGLYKICGPEERLLRCLYLNELFGQVRLTDLCLSLASLNRKGCATRRVFALNGAGEWECVLEECAG